MIGWGDKRLISGSWSEPALRFSSAAGVILVATVLLWQAGLLFAVGAEEIALTDSDGEERLLQVRPADTGVQTPASADRRSVGPNVGQLAPNFEVSNLEGKRVQLADYRGQPVLLNFWASWCAPCVAEMPDMQAVMERFADEGLVVFAMNAGERLEPAFFFVKGLGVSFTEIGLDPGEDVIRLYRVHGLPTSFFIDGDGVVTRVQLGQMTEEQIVAYVLETLASKEERPNATAAR
jgi:thiol-disulfide isomerase/thioredoxin